MGSWSSPCQWRNSVGGCCLSLSPTCSSSQVSLQAFGDSLCFVLSLFFVCIFSSTFMAKIPAISRSSQLEWLLEEEKMTPNITVRLFLCFVDKKKHKRLWSTLVLTFVWVWRRRGFILRRNVRTAKGRNAVKVTLCVPNSNWYPKRKPLCKHTHPGPRRPQHLTSIFILSDCSTPSWGRGFLSHPHLAGNFHNPSIS